MLRTPIILALILTALGGDDPYCPAYPEPQRQVFQARLEVERSVRAMTHFVGPTLIWSGPRWDTSTNIIDQHIFSRSSRDGVDPAPLTSDTEILRRLSLDLTGRIPSIEKVQSFAASTDTTKRIKLIDELIGSEAFVDYWTAFFANHFEVTSEYYYFIGIPGRNVFYIFLRGFVSGDRTYAEDVTKLIASTSDSHEMGA